MPQIYFLEYIRAITEHVRKEKMDTDCWQFENPYKRVDLNGKNVLVHLLEFILKHGRDEYDKATKEGRNHIAHNCNSTRCAKPEHLSQDTPKGNGRDRIENGTNGEG